MGIYFFGSIRKKIKTENLDTIYATLVSEDILKHLELVAVTTEEEKDAAWAQTVIAAYESDEMKAYMEEHNQEDYWFIPEELQ